jgi:hypothetical protein
MSQLKRITIFVLLDEDSTDFDWVCAWLEKWAGQVTITDCSSGGWEQLWNVEAPQEAVSEVPEDYLCSSAWSRSGLFARPSFWQRIKVFFKYVIFD